jgi:hypothetical protein
MKGTFNLDGFDHDGGRVSNVHPRIDPKNATACFEEDCIHTYKHPYLEQMPIGCAEWEVAKDRQIL